ncbi:unnamed protein product [Paramecium sonneborni]|uniref:Uncharacterized protein n=1 Tax=Paramecium sonneborni TaxID=65129 RepID=A0A8S1NLY4_9CILI|nr:unnamed protein product [Paramecium sonneborni]
MMKQRFQRIFKNTLSRSVSSFGRVLDFPIKREGSKPCTPNFFIFIKYFYPVQEVSSMLGSIQVKEYPIFDVKKGVLTKKKVKFHIMMMKKLKSSLNVKNLNIVLLMKRFQRFHQKDLIYQELEFWFQIIFKIIRYHQQLMLMIIILVQQNGRSYLNQIL